MESRAKLYATEVEQDYDTPTKDAVYTKAIGEDIFDGFAFTYKGGYVHSWNYGDYSSYVPASRPWYQTAEKANGEVAVVAPYVTFLSNTDMIEDYDILRMSIVQKYNTEYVKEKKRRSRERADYSVYDLSGVRVLLCEDDSDFGSQCQCL